MKTVGAYEARTHFSQLLDEVERGEEIEITRHGRVVARLTPAPPIDRERVRKAVAELRRLSQGIHVTREEIREWIDEGRE